MDINPYQVATRSSRWALYEQLVAGVPEGVEVTDYCIGGNWCYVVAESGMGIGHHVRGGGRESFRDDPRNVDLKTLAGLATSWNFREASLGVAALNAWYSQADRLARIGAEFDFAHVGSADRANPFTFMQDEFAGKKVAVVGHFPNVERMAGQMELTVLERNCASPLDIPDSACEYILSDQDYVLLTGTTIINKTAPRIFELCSAATVVMVGPSTVPGNVLFDAGVGVQCGSVVVDQESAAFAVKGGSKDLWRHGIKKYLLRARRVGS